jgi:hypothetical protein
MQRVILFILFSFLIACTKVEVELPAKVEIIKQLDGYVLLVNGKPFQVKGAGLNYPDGHNFKALKEAGGNSFRTWSTDFAKEELAAAKEHGLMVLMGINLEKELHGFDYNDEEAVKKQFDSVKKQVQQYKNHPNLLGWIVANEPNLLIGEDGSLQMVNPKVYDAINDIINYIHQEDPNHPVTYSFAGMMKEHLDVALARTPTVDFVSVQVYGDLVNLHDKINLAGFDKPFMVTEFGPIGHWERPSTEWSREIEEPSGVKASSFAERLQLAFSENKTGKNIGHFAFEWGQKQERTPTWYGMFNKDGKPNARVDEITKFWTGKYPENRAPLVSSIVINNQTAIENVYVKAGQIANVKVVFTEPNKDQTEIEWVLLKEVDIRSQGGALEKEPEKVNFTFSETQQIIQSDEISAFMEFTAPSTPGAYRLFSYIYDGKGKVGNANFPFYVK